MTPKLNVNKINKSFTRQHSQFYCGLACLSSVIKYHGGETTQEKLREISGTTLNGTSLLGLYQAAQKMGFEVAGYEAGIENLKEFSQPVILHIVKDKTQEHFVVCYGFENSKFIAGDPANGIEYYTEEELSTVWKSRAMLQLTPGKNFVTRKNDSKNKRTWFLQLLKPDYPVLGIAAFLGIVISVLGLATADPYPDFGPYHICSNTDCPGCYYVYSCYFPGPPKPRNECAVNLSFFWKITVPSQTLFRQYFNR